MRFLLLFSLLAACGSGAGSQGDVAPTSDADAGCSCDGLECGYNACGEACGPCPAAAPYCNDHRCEADCQARSCDGRVCGPDGCGGSCGLCAENEACELGQCVCHPRCDGAVCSDDGCGGSCGECESGTGCFDGACVACGCDSLGLECGSGPCGESCGGCPAEAPSCLHGRCNDGQCPKAVILIQEGEEVSLPTRLHIVGSQSWAQRGSVEAYAWEVEQPAGSQSSFQPSAHAPDPTFEANVAGTYVFRLTVTDSHSVTSCVPAERTVHVGVVDGIRVVLTWTTPGDPDETNEGPKAGADLDLHFVHPAATGGYDGDGDGVEDGYFDARYDCFYANPHPDWGAPDAPLGDDPWLDRDDTDGLGPEAVRLREPESGATYKIGVYYASDHGFGPSLAKVSVYVYDALAYESPLVELVSRDMWTVGTLTWPAATVTPAWVCAGTTTPCESDDDCLPGSCVPRVVHAYEHPDYPEQ